MSRARRSARSSRSAPDRRGCLPSACIVRGGPSRRGPGRRRSSFVRPGSGRASALRRWQRRDAARASSWSKALASRSISARPAPNALATVRQAPTPLATRRIDDRASRPPSSKNGAISSTRARSQVPSSRSIDVVNLRSRTSTDAELRSKAGDNRQPSRPPHRNPWLRR